MAPGKCCPYGLAKTIIRRHRLWTVSLLDTKGIVFARAPNPSETVGKQASGAVTCVLDETR
ncbi:hypothetical protein EAS61_00040 [Bradyrhizobium zhanjiangense]|uniref:Uncharacterized protein n=1 Tax=Bradyrhizobium zhanjiangense TaxID=1325107 RepID=A0A4Q0QZ65_9BRAD|nr:hypothetical protein EAS61_00040 [Bradyrhizobium zhanjiangense]